MVVVTAEAVEVAVTMLVVALDVGQTNEEPGGEY